MPGTPVVDMLAVVPSWPPSKEQQEALAEASYESKGMAPHADKDMWYFGGDGPSGTLGRSVLHIVQAGNPFIEFSLAFVEYVRSHREDFDAYAHAKVEGARLALIEGADGQKLTMYKDLKRNVCLQVLGRAKAWAARSPR